MSIFEIIDPVGELYPKAFVEAIPIVEAILSKQEFLDILVDLYPKMNVGCASGLLSTEGKFKVDTIQLKADCDAYACVYVGVPGRDSDYFTIYFNPLLLLRAKRLEDSAKHSGSDTVSLIGKRPASPIVAAQSKKPRTKAAALGTEAVPVPVADEVDVRLTMFFVIKLIHEVSQILNYHCNPDVDKNHRTPPMKPVPECPVTFKDFGDMIEYRLFGGVLEHHEEPTLEEKCAFSVQGIVRYPFPGGDGVHVSWNREQLSITKDSAWEEILQKLKPIVGAAYEGSYSGNRNKLKLPTSKASTAYDTTFDTEECVSLAKA